MQYSTLLQVKTRLKNECDLFDEGFIDEDVELLGYINSAIDSAEAIIHKLYEGYFENKATLTLISGTSTYSPPSDIYGNKLTAIWFNDGTKQYEIKRLRNRKQYYALKNTQSTNRYGYILTNDGTTGIKIEIVPTPSASGGVGAVGEFWYIRNAKTVSNDTDSCDIPEFINFIYAHVKWYVARKEKLQIDLATAEKEFLIQKDLMEATLTDMVPDDDSSLILPDISFYDDFDDYLYGDY